jgi:GNAT superfamily N-acetyltransferase
MLVDGNAGTIIGSILVGHDGLRGWIYKLAVAESERGKGRGAALVHAAERWLTARGVPKCNLMIRATNAGVISFYEKLGYQVSGHAVMGHWLRATPQGAPVDMEPAMIDVLVTNLEMVEAPMRPGPALPRGNHALMRLDRPTTGFYRYLYDSVSEGSFWFKRRQMTDTELAGLITHPEVEILVLYAGGQPAGFVELDRRQANEIRIPHFGLLPGFGGRGLGRYLLHWAVENAWSHQPARLVAETTSLDHPRTLGTYQRVGFRPSSQQKQRILDPRVSGLVPPHLTLPHPVSAVPSGDTAPGTLPFTGPRPSRG